MTGGGEPERLPGDNPIRCAEHDILERADVAEAFARHVLELDASEGAVVSVFGPWGSGKTSFVNLARKTIECAGVPVLEFNPWLFSGTEQLVERFFAELSAGMGENNELKEVGEAFGKYGAALNALAGAASVLLAMPQIGAVVETMTTTAKCVAQTKSVGALRQEIERALESRDGPMIVVLDDVDRLSASEVREIFKLVRLTASFPNLVYVVACDRRRVERALDEKEQGLSGRDYLEKIVQFPYHLPEIPRHILHEQIGAAIDGALVGIGNRGPFDEQAWPDVRAKIVAPLIGNVRDLRRYAIAVRQTVVGLDGEIALTDVLGLEAVRVFLPDVFERIPRAIDALTLASREIGRHLDTMTRIDPADPISGLNKWLKARMDEVIEAAERDGVRAEIEAMVDLLFPAGSPFLRMSDGDSDPYSNENAAEQLRARRVAHEHVLRLYLERVAGPDLLAFYDAERALALMADRDGLYRFLRSLDRARWRDVISNLCLLGDRFQPEHAESGIEVLLNLWPDMPEWSSSLSFLEDIKRNIRQIAFELLRQLEGVAAVEAAVCLILPRVTSLTAKVELVLLIGYRKNVGSKLVSENAATEFEARLCNEIRSAPTGDLARERGLCRVLHFGKHGATAAEPSLEIADTPELTFALLWSSRGELTAGSLGSRAVRRTQTLMWDVLMDLYGGEDTLKMRIESLNARFGELKRWLDGQGISRDDAVSLLELANQYLIGCRPGQC